ncbi:MAG TPA: hypothetical protein PLH11_10465 [Gemmobacter sp.]|nr:hypothetical protein [Gemmobacter sp.]
MPNTSPFAATVLEVVRFQTDETVSEQEFVRLFESTRALISAQPGFLARQLIRADDGAWTDLVLWCNRQQAEQAAAGVIAAPAFAGFMAAIRPDSVAMSHHRLVATMAVDG